jgi:hypothetical protein
MMKKISRIVVALCLGCAALGIVGPSPAMAAPPDCEAALANTLASPPPPPSAAELIVVGPATIDVHGELLLAYALQLQTHVANAANAYVACINAEVGDVVTRVTTIQACLVPVYSGIVRDLVRGPTPMPLNGIDLRYVTIGADGHVTINQGQAIADASAIAACIK